MPLKGLRRRTRNASVPSLRDSGSVFRGTLFWKGTRGTRGTPQEKMKASLLWTFLAFHMHPGVVLVFSMPSRILSLPCTKVNHDYQVHSQHFEQVVFLLCSWESEWARVWALWGLFLLVPACSWGSRAGPCWPVSYLVNYTMYTR